VRELADTPDDECWSFNMCRNIEECRKGVLTDIFGTDKLNEISLDAIRLARHPGNDLTDKKILSISKKYFTIPADKLSYYPALPETSAEAAEALRREEEETETVSEVLNKKKRHKGALSANKKPHKILSKKPKIGRPKNSTKMVADPNAPSILQFMKFAPRRPTLPGPQDSPGGENVIQSSDDEA
jgi:hypothetical protein